MLTWIAVFLSILFSITIDKFLFTSSIPLQNQELRSEISKWFFSFFSDIRWGQYLAGKWFIVIISFAIFFIWFIKNKNILEIIKRNIVPILLIPLVLFATRYFSFDHWFYRDDYYIFQQFQDKTLLGGLIDNQYVPCCGFGYYPTGMLYLIMHWLGNNYFAYKLFGLVEYVFVGYLIYAIINKLFKNRLVALFSALFFLTIPTYFQETLLIGELIGDAFALNLYLISFYLLLEGFYPGLVIFSFASLQFGLTRTHFLAAPLLLTGILLKDKKVSFKKALITLSPIVLLSLIFIPILIGSESNTYGKILPSLNNLLVFADNILSVSLPFSLNVGLVSISRWLFGNFTYISAILGIILILTIVLIIFIFIKKKRFLQAKITFIGLISLLAADLFPAMWGIRVDHEFKTIFNNYISGIIPPGSTGYGLFPTFGITLIFGSILSLLKKRAVVTVSLLIIALGIATFIRADLNWTKEYSSKQRHIDAQLEELFPRDGKPKLIFSAEKGNHLALGATYYWNILRVDDPIIVESDPEKFVSEINSKKIDKDHIFLLNLNQDTYNIYDFSKRLRNAPIWQYTKILKESMKENI